MKWQVRFTGPAAKATSALPKAVRLTLAALVAEPELFGPAMHGRGWRHFGKLQGRKTDDYHCHLKAGRPTFVARWRVDRPSRVVEVYYVGTHENAPY